MVMDVIWCRHCVSIICSDMGKSAMSGAGKYLFRAANVWWWCAQYFAIASCG